MGQCHMAMKARAIGGEDEGALARANEEADLGLGAAPMS